MQTFISSFNSYCFLLQFPDHSTMVDKQHGLKIKNKGCKNRFKLKYEVANTKLQLKNEGCEYEITTKNEGCK